MYSLDNLHLKHNGKIKLNFDGGDLLKIKLRNGSVYISSGVVDFLKPLLDEYEESYPDVKLFLRADGGFAKPELSSQVEINGASYVIRLKPNENLYKLAETATFRMNDLTKDNRHDYPIIHDEFDY